MHLFLNNMLGVREVFLVHLLGLTGVLCQELDFMNVLEQALEFQEALGDDFRNGDCFRDSMDVITTVTSNRSFPEKIWALKCKLT